jgi:hypothetical protein
MAAKKVETDERDDRTPINLTAAESEIGPTMCLSRIFDATGNLERVIPFHDANRKL